MWRHQQQPPLLLAHRRVHALLVLLALLALLLARGDARKHGRRQVVRGEGVGGGGGVAEVLQRVQLFVHEVHIDDALFLWKVVNTNM